MPKTAVTFLEGDPGRVLFQKSIQMLFGILGIVAFNLADTYFVGRLGTRELAAMGFTFPVVLGVGSISLGLGIGTSALISRAIGGSDKDEVQFLTTSALALSLLVVIAVVAMGLPLLRPLFKSLGAEGKVLELVIQYMTIWLFGVPFVITPMVGNNALRATGDMRTPAIVMMSAAAMNIVLDPLLIFGIGPFPQMGLAGAAVATVIARMAALAVGLYVLHVRYRMIDVRFAALRNTRTPAKTLLRSWTALLRLAIPAAATRVVLPLSLGVVTRIVSSFGTAAVAGFAVGNRVETLAIAFLQSMGTVATPYFGQNVTAGRYDRLVGGTQRAFQFAFLWSGAVFAAALSAGNAIAGLFSSDPAAVQIAARYLRIVAGSYGFFGVMIFSSAAFNGLNQPLLAALPSISRMAVLYVPLALALRIVAGIDGVFVAAAIANVGVGLFAGAMLWRRISAAST